MKKLISLLIVAAMLVTGLVAVIPGTAVDLPETDLYTHVTGEINEAQDTLTMRVSIGNNPGLWCYRIFVSYNAAALQLTSVTNTEEVWTNSQYTPGNIDANPTVYYAEMGASLTNNYNNGVVAVYTFSILDAEADFNVNVTFNPDEVFGVDDNYDKVIYEMQIINECPQYVPIDTTALDALAEEIMALPDTYEELQGDQLDKMLSLYESVHALEGRSEAYFTETYADAITKIDGLYADHQWALVKAELDALGARVEALPDYADMTDEQVQEMLDLRTEIAALEGQEKEYVETTYADALARLEASYEAMMHEEGLNAIGARIEALPAYEEMTEAQISEMLALTEELEALSEEDLAYITTTYADAYARLQASQAAYAHAQELDAVGARIEALPAYAEMTEAQVEEMLALIETLGAMPEEDVAYISGNYSEAYTRLNESYARYQRIQELDALGARMEALPDSYYDMTEEQIAEMVALYEEVSAISDTSDQEYLLANYEDALYLLAENYILYMQDELYQELKARIEALPAYEDITEDYLEEVTELRLATALIMSAQLKEEIPEAYDNFVNAYMKLVYGGTDVVDMDEVTAFVAAVEALTPDQDQEMLDLLYEIFNVSEEDAVFVDYVTLAYPETFNTLLERYYELLLEEEVDYEALYTLSEEILALPAYEDMTEEDKAALGDIIDTVSGLSPLAMFEFKVGFADAYEAYLTLYAAYEADRGEEEPPVTTNPDETTTPGGGDTTAPGGGDTTTPQTGDNMVYIVIAVAVAAIVCTAVVVIRKRKETV